METACGLANSYTYGETLGSSLADLGDFSYSEDDYAVRNPLNPNADTHRNTTKYRGFAYHDDGIKFAGALFGCFYTWLFDVNTCVGYMGNN